jgi:hypothetical protein
MKNKNNVTVKQLVTAMLEAQVKEGNSTYRYAHVTGALEAILQEALELDRVPKSRRYRSIQEAVNSYYNVVNGECPAGV